jgi:hypothetical protein
MKKLLFLALILAGSAALAQGNLRVRGTITSIDGDVVSVKSRDGKDMKLHLTPDAQVATAKKLSLEQIKPGTYVGVTSLQQGGRLVAKEVHLIPPAAPSGHMNWDLMPGSMMTNANLDAVVQAAGGNQITLKYKDGEQRVTVPSGTPIIGFDNADRSALKAGETIWTNARVDGDRLVTNRIQVSKDGVKPEH